MSKEDSSPDDLIQILEVYSEKDGVFLVGLEIEIGTGKFLIYRNQKAMPGIRTDPTGRGFIPGINERLEKRLSFVIPMVNK